MLCVVPYHHEIVVKLGEYRLDTFAVPFVCPGRRTSVFLIQPIWDFQGNIGRFEEILLNFGTEITLVSEHHAVMIFPAYIVEEIEVMNACRSHDIRMYYVMYPAYFMEFIPVIAKTPRGTESPVRMRPGNVATHGAMPGTTVLANLHVLGVKAEHAFGDVYGGCYLPTDFLGKPDRQLAAHIELTTADQAW